MNSPRTRAAGLRGAKLLSQAAGRSADSAAPEPADASRDRTDAGEAVRRSVQSIEVGGRLLLALADSRAGLPLKELAALAALTPSRAHPYLVGYQRLGLVAQDPVSGHYALGPAALQLGLTALHQLDAVKAATPVAEALARDTGHAVALAVWGNFGPTVVRLIEARNPLHVLLRAGSVMSLFDTATGRAFVAALPPERLRQAVLRHASDESGLGVHSPREQREQIAQIVEEARHHGISRTSGRPIPGINAFSAAALDHEGEPAIVITALDHQDRLAADWRGPTAAAVRTAGERISRSLGGLPSRTG
ncbi:MAG: IclR family transcriptional regulator [Lautropia sp.]